MRFFGDWEAFWRAGFDIESFGGEDFGSNGGLEIERALGAEEGLRMGENLKNAENLRVEENLKIKGLRGGEYDIAAISKGAMGGVMSDGVSEALEFAYMRYEARRRIGRVSLLFFGEDSIDFSSWESRLLDLLDYGVEMEIFITASQPRSEELAEFFRAFGVVYWLKSLKLARELFVSFGFDTRKESFIRQVE